MRKNRVNSFLGFRQKQSDRGRRTRIIELTPSGTIDKLMEYDEYISNEAIKEQKDRMYGTTA